MADIRGRDVKVPVGGQRIEGGFTAQACAIELQCLRYGRRRRNGDRCRLEASPGPDEELIPEMVAALLEVAAKRWLGNVESIRGTAPALCAHLRLEPRQMHAWKHRSNLEQKTAVSGK